MTNQTIYVTNSNLEKIRALIAGVQASRLTRTQTTLDKLEKELDKAKVISPRKVPRDVVTMNTQVRVLDIESNIQTTYTIVYPAQADIAKNRISILAPIGTALLGYRVGDIVEWEVPSGLKHFKIQEILYQPEAAGTQER